MSQAPLNLPPALWLKRTKLKYCERCERYYVETLEKCSHCSDLTDTEVLALKEKQKETLEGNTHLGKYFVLATIILAGVLLFSFLS